MTWSVVLSQPHLDRVVYVIAPFTREEDAGQWVRDNAAGLGTLRAHIVRLSTPQFAMAFFSPAMMD